MSLRTRAGAGPNPGLPTTPRFAPHSTFPTRVAALPPNSRGSRLFALGHAYRPLAQRDREQLDAARALAPGLIAPSSFSRPIGEGTARRSFRPMTVDRGFRRPYYIPPTPGSSGGSGSGSGAGGSDNNGGCNGC